MRARGANALLRALFETTYGTPPAAITSSCRSSARTSAPEQGLIESDLLGQGREGFDPTLDVVNNDGNLVVPVDAAQLRLLAGALFRRAGHDRRRPRRRVDRSARSRRPARRSPSTAPPSPSSPRARPATRSTSARALSDTLDNAVTVLNASVVAGVALATYSKTGTDHADDPNDAAGTPATPSRSPPRALAGEQRHGLGATLTGGTNKHVFTSGATRCRRCRSRPACPKCRASR
jgi:hypothetical protein